MRNIPDTTPHIQANLAIDAKLLDELTLLGIIANGTDFGRACGKNETYYFCMRKRGYGLHIGSLAFLQARLAREINETDDVRKRARLRTAIGAVNEAVQQKCKLRELELFG